jgi:hypothetical protein
MHFITPSSYKDAVHLDIIHSIQEHIANEKVVEVAGLGERAVV